MGFGGLTANFANYANLVGEWGQTPGSMYDVTDNDLQKLFEQHGQVESARVVMDRDTGRFKGFGSETLNDSAEVEKAIAATNEMDMSGGGSRASVCVE
jgi:RNA recognition motif-containing protein